MKLSFHTAPDTAINDTEDVVSIYEVKHQGRELGLVFKQVLPMTGPYAGDVVTWFIADTDGDSLPGGYLTRGEAAEALLNRMVANDYNGTGHLK